MKDGSTSNGQPSVLSRVVSGSVGVSVYLLAFNPLEVVKVRHQAASGGRGAPSASSAVKMFHRGRNAVVMRNGLVLPKRAFPCLLSPGLSVPGVAVDLSPVDRMCKRFFDVTSHILPRARTGSRGILGTLGAIHRTEGFTGLYKGVSPALMAAVPNTAIYFTLCDELMARGRSRYMAKHSVSEDEARRQLGIPLVSAAVARLVASIFTAPLELLKVREANCRTSTSIVQEARHVWRKRGPLGFYRGPGSIILRDVPFSSVLFLSMEAFKTALRDSDVLGRYGVRHYAESDVLGRYG